MRRLADWIGGAVWGVVTYRLWRRWRRPVPASDTVSVDIASVDAEADARAEELRAKLAESRAAEEPDSDPAEPPTELDSVEERRRRVHEEGRAAIDRMNDN